MNWDAIGADDPITSNPLGPTPPLKSKRERLTWMRMYELSEVMTTRVVTMRCVVMIDPFIRT